MLTENDEIMNGMGKIRIQQLKKINKWEIQLKFLKI